MKRLLLLSAFLIFACSSDSSDTNDNNVNNDELLNCDGNPVPTIVYGTQEWAVENACHTTYRDGTPIPEALDLNNLAELTTGAWVNIQNNQNYNRLYNWYAIMGIHDNDPNTPNKQFAPVNWGVPSDLDWSLLAEQLIIDNYNFFESPSPFGVNTLAKSMSSVEGWNISSNVGVPGNTDSANNSSGFNAKPFGALAYASGPQSFGVSTTFWSKTESSSESLNGNVLYRGNYVYLANSWAQFYYTGDGNGFVYGTDKQNFFSVRLIKD